MTLVDNWALPRPSPAGDDDRWVTVDLAEHRDNVGITAPESTAGGRLNIWRNSLPAGELPVGRTVRVGGVPFAFPPAGTGVPDNVRCNGQIVAVPPGRYDWLHLLVTAERRVEDEVMLLYADGQADDEPLRVSDFWAAPAAFGEVEAFRTTTMHYPQHVQPHVDGVIWAQRLAVPRRADLHAVVLPDHVAVHVFAATLRRSEPVTEPEVTR